MNQKQDTDLEFLCDFVQAKLEKNIKKHIPLIKHIADIIKC